MVAIPLIFGRLTAADYEDDIATNPLVDLLRQKMEVRENKSFTADYFDPSKRYIGNAIQIFFKDGSNTEYVSIDFPIGHRERRHEGIPVLKKKFQSSIQSKLCNKQWDILNKIFTDKARFNKMAVDEFMSLLVV